MSIAGLTSSIADIAAPLVALLRRALTAASGQQDCHHAGRQKLLVLRCLFATRRMVRKLGIRPLSTSQSPLGYRFLFSLIYFGALYLRIEEYPFAEAYAALRSVVHPLKFSNASSISPFSPAVRYTPKATTRRIRRKAIIPDPSALLQPRHAIFRRHQRRRATDAVLPVQTGDNSALRKLPDRNHQIRRLPLA